MPTRAQYLRVIHLELNRIASHLIWLGTSALDLGAISIFLYCLRERELILDLFEMSSGARMHTRYFQVGGVIEDIPAGFAAKLREFLKIMPERADEYGAILNSNEIVLQRLRGTCPLDAETLLALGVTGPLLRAAGNPWDLRKAAPYSSYDDFEFKIPVGTVGDNYDRFAVRLAEIYESVKIIEQALDGLPEGPHITERPQGRAAAPPRAGDLDGGADPPLQARHRGLPRAARARCTTRSSPRAASSAASCARTARSKPARVHMRDPQLRQPAGARADGRGQLHRRHDRHDRDARSDPREGSTDERRRAAGSACPAGTCPPTSTRTRRRSPTPRPRRSRRSCAREIEAHMALYPDRRSAALPALAAAQRVHGWCSPEAIEQVACVMRVTPAYLDAVATFYDMLETEPVGAHSDLRVHEHLLLAARRRRAVRGDPRGRGRGSDVQRARVRVPRRVRHRADGLRRRRLRRAAADRRRAPAAGRHARRARRCCPTSSSRAACADPERRASSSTPGAAGAPPSRS